MKRTLLQLWSLESHVRSFIAVSRFLFHRVPLLGGALSLLLDRVLFILYGLDVQSSSVNVGRLMIAHPGGVLLGGNGIVSSGRVAIMSGVSFVARSPNDPEYLERHKTKSVFRLGDNVVIGAGSVVIGPISICDDVVVGAMSLVNKSIAEPGVYVGVPVRKVSDRVSDEWVSH